MTRDDDPDDRKTLDRVKSRVATQPLPTVVEVPALADDHDDSLAKTLARTAAHDDSLATSIAAKPTTGAALAAALANAGTHDDSLATTVARPALPREARMFDVATTTELPSIRRSDLSSTAVEAFAPGAKQIDMLASISPDTAAAAEHVRNEALGRALGSTHVEEFPTGAKQIDPLASISPDNVAAARRVRDEALGSVMSATNIDVLPEGARQIDPLASISPDNVAAARRVRDETLSSAISATDIEAFPTGAKQIDPLASISPDSAAVARHLRDQALSSVMSATHIDPLPEGARQIDPLASISPDNAAAAQQVRNEALEAVRRVTGINALPTEPVDPLASITPENQALARQMRDEALGMRDNIDLNATIVSKRGSTAAEHVRDAAFEKLRDGSADDLRETVARPRRLSDGPLGGERRSANIAASEDRSGRLAAVERSSDSMASQRASVGMRAHRPSEGASARPSNVRAIADDLAHGDGATALDEQDLALIARVRALPDEGQEPDWRVLEGSIREQVRDKPTYVPWWRAWQYLVPLGALAATAAIAFIVVKIARREPDRTSLLTAPRDAGAETQSAHDDTHGTSTTLWLDGEPFELDDIEPEALDDIAPALDGSDDGNEIDDSSDDGAAPVEVDAELDDAGNGILPMTDFGWIDALDDGEVERAESWLARKPS